MRLVDALLERTAVYRAWQAPFAGRKFAPVQEHNDIGAARRVLDVGCGPGTNARHFAHADYLGIDINPAYVESARRRYGRRFEVHDVCRYEVADERRYDFVLVNSFLHHIPTPDVRRVLSQVRTLLAPGGHVHALELVLPEDRSVGQLLARWDRGDHARPLAEWRRLFEEHYETVVFAPYSLGVAGTTLWNMVYFKGRPPGPSA